MRPGTIYLGSLMPLRHLDAVRALAARKVTGFLDRRDSAHDARAGHGHALVDGQYRRLQRRPPRRRGAESLFSHAHDRRRHGPSRQGVRHRRRRGGPPGDRDRPAPRRQRRRDRRAARSQGADRERRRQVRRHRAQGERGGRRRLREGAVGGGPRPPGPVARRGMRPVRRRDHDGAHRRRLRAAPHQRRHREDDEARVGHRRSAAPTAAGTASCRRRARRCTSTASPFSPRSTCPRRCRSTPACCFRGT